VQHANARDREHKQINDFQQDQVGKPAGCSFSAARVAAGRSVSLHAARLRALTLMLDPRYKLLHDVYKLQ
jgi:hypothetical protein